MVTYRCVAESISKLHGPSTLLRGKLPTSESKNAGRPNRREKERKMPSTWEQSSDTARSDQLRPENTRIRN